MLGGFNKSTIAALFAFSSWDPTNRDSGSIPQDSTERRQTYFSSQVPTFPAVSTTLLFLFPFSFPCKIKQSFFCNKEGKTCSATNMQGLPRPKVDFAQLVIKIQLSWFATTQYRFERGRIDFGVGEKTKCRHNHRRPKLTTRFCNANLCNKRV